MDVENVNMLGIDDYNVDEVIELELEATMKKDGTIHLVYQRQYYDDEDNGLFLYQFYYIQKCALSQLNRLNNKDFKQKVKEFCDKNYKETATNDTVIQRLI